MRRGEEGGRKEQEDERQTRLEEYDLIRISVQELWCTYMGTSWHKALEQHFLYFYLVRAIEYKQVS